MFNGRNFKAHNLITVTSLTGKQDNGEPIPIAAESTTTFAVDDHKQEVRFSEPSISTSSTTGITKIVNKNYYFS